MAGEDDEFENLDGSPEDEEAVEEVVEDELDDGAEDDKLPDVVVVEDDEDFEDLDANIPGVDDEDELVEEAEAAAAEDGDELADDGDLDAELEKALAGEDTSNDLSDIKSPKIRDRIMRERRKAGEAVDGAKAAETSLRQVRTRAWDTVHKAHVQRTTEVGAMAQSVVEAASAVIELNRERLKGAREAGNADQEFEAQDAIASWTKVLETVTPVVNKTKSERERIDGWRKGLSEEMPLVSGQPNQQPAQQSQDQQPDIPEMAKDWLSRNQWFEEDKHIDVRNYAMGVETKLLKASYKPDDPKMYDLIARAVAKRFPEVQVMDLKGRRVAGETEKSVRRKTGNRRRGEEGVTAKSGTLRKKGSSATLSKVDAAKMRNFGLNPRDPTHVKEWQANSTVSRPTRRRESARQVV